MKTALTKSSTLFIYNANKHDIFIKFYLQNDWLGISSAVTTSTEKLLKAGTKEIYTASYTVQDGVIKYTSGGTEKTLSDPAKLYVRLDVYNEKGTSGEIPAGTTYYVQAYNNNAELSLTKLTGVTFYYAKAEDIPTPKPTSSVTSEKFPDVDFVYKTVENGDAENGTKNWASWNGGTIELSTDTKTGNGSSIHFHKASGRWSTPTFQVQNAILQNEEAMLGGSGAGTYIVTYDAKASAEFKANATRRIKTA